MSDEDKVEIKEKDEKEQKKKLGRKKKEKEPAPEKVKRKRRKMLKRCTSPSHFFVDEDEETIFGPEFTLDLPGRDRVDSLLRAVALMYYQPKEVHANGNTVRNYFVGFQR